MALPASGKPCARTKPCSSPRSHPEPRPKCPTGWEALGRFLSSLFAPVGEALAALGRLIGLSGTALAWTAGIVVGALLLFLLVRLLAEARLARRRRNQGDDTPGWAPQAKAAQALLQDADRLAEQGRYEEATRLLLRRSVQQIAENRPGLLEPSSTAREIAALPALPAAARGAFAVIAERVERSLFALRSLSAEDWQAARAAYADFALAAPGAAA
jgi:hypothetical protein